MRWDSYRYKNNPRSMEYIQAVNIKMGGSRTESVWYSASIPAWLSPVVVSAGGIVRSALDATDRRFRQRRARRGRARQRWVARPSRTRIYF